MYAEILASNSDTTYMVSRLFYEKHIYFALDDEGRDVWTVHRILREIEEGQRLCVGVFNKHDNSFAGCAHGMIYPYTMEAHLLFKRKVNGVEALKLCMDKCSEYYRHKKIPLLRFTGMVADNNRAAKLLLKKSGFIDKGIVDGEDFVSKNNIIPCRYFRKDI